MPSVSIQARIDGELWEGMRIDGETNTQLLQRIAVHYLATSGNQLSTVAPTPAAAIAVLFHSHRLLNQLAAGKALSEPQPVAVPLKEQRQQAQSAAECANEW